jgi:hypothetical protein
VTRAATVASPPQRRGTEPLSPCTAVTRTAHALHGSARTPLRRRGGLCAAAAAAARRPARRGCGPAEASRGEPRPAGSARGRCAPAAAPRAGAPAGTPGPAVGEGVSLAGEWVADDWRRWGLGLTRTRLELAGAPAGTPGPAVGEGVSRNGLVSDPPPEIPTVPIRNFCIAVWWWHCGSHQPVRELECWSGSWSAA